MIPKKGPDVFLHKRTIKNPEEEEQALYTFLEKNKGKENVFPTPVNGLLFRKNEKGVFICKPETKSWKKVF